MLSAAVIEDQRIRSTPNWEESEVAGVDQANAELLQLVLHSCGWPDSIRFSQEADYAAWLLAQHADDHPSLQGRALLLVREAVARGGAQPEHVAYLEDRINVREGRPQVYGTQGACNSDGSWNEAPTLNPSMLDERRSAVGLESMLQYREVMSAHCAGGH